MVCPSCGDEISRKFFSQVRRTCYYCLSNRPNPVHRPTPWSKPFTESALDKVIVRHGAGDKVITILGGKKCHLTIWPKDYFTTQEVAARSCVRYVAPRHAPSNIEGIGKVQMDYQGYVG